MRRGTVCWVTLGTTHPPEFGKMRPALVVSNSVQNEALESVVVVPLSTSEGEIWPLRVKLEGVLERPSFAVLPGIRQVAKSRVGDTVAILRNEGISQIDRALAAYLRD